MSIKSKSKKLIFLLLFLLSDLFLTTSCQKDFTNDIEVVESTKTLSVLYFGENRSLESIFQKFENQHKNISIFTEYLSSGQYAETIQERISSGIKVADVIFMRSDYGLFLSLANRGRLVDLSEYAVLQHYPKDNLLLYQVNHKQYGIPFSSNFLITCYNIKILENYGLDIPKTWEETQFVFDTLMEHDILPITFGGEQNASFYNTFVPILMSVLETHHQADSFMKDLQRGKVSADDPVILEYLDLIKDITERGYFSPKNLLFKENESIDYFKEQKAGVLLTDEESINSINDDFYETAPLPLYNGKVKNCASIGYVLGIDSKSEFIPEALDILEFLSEDDIVDEYVSTTGQNILTYSLFDSSSEKKIHLDPMIYVEDCELWIKQPFSNMTAKIMTGQKIADVVEDTQILFDDLSIPQYVFLS
ncbi:Maltose-binding periplasmic proteins/domains [uncultured Ruminococcus sp.]|nr:Maltose-binding periplasmic proteins/domains [uncultured Clostridium sp.]SCI45843.1 Maltose-binding periplasmic proteins/domains [uncultured Ruminococcus sp.]